MISKIINSHLAIYIQDVLSTDYQAPLIMANEVESIHRNSRDIHILDVGAGTGLVGKQVS